MALRCSLLGCNYDETAIEHEREERGSEVVLTVTEYEECSRCGERNVISENTGVTSIAAEPDHPAIDDERLDTDDVAESEPAVTEDGAVTEEPPTESVTETDTPSEDPTSDSGVEILSDDSGAAGTADEGTEADNSGIGMDKLAAMGEGGTQSGSSGSDTASDSDSDPGGSPKPEERDGPITDDGEILDPEPETTEPARERGEWPENDDVDQPTPEEAVTRLKPDDNTTAEDGIDEVPDDDAVLLDTGDDSASASGDTTHSGVETGAGTTTSESESKSKAESDPESRSGTETETGIASANAAPSPGNPSPVGSGPTDLHCPNCEFTKPGDGSSLRPGDICPDCQRGYLGERERASE